MDRLQERNQTFELADDVHDQYVMQNVHEHVFF